MRTGWVVACCGAVEDSDVTVVVEDSDGTVVVEDSYVTVVVV